MQNIALLCLTFQAEKHTELRGVRQIAFMIQHIDLENTGASMLIAAYRFFLCFWDVSSEHRNPAIRPFPPTALCP